MAPATPCGRCRENFCHGDIPRRSRLFLSRKGPRDGEVAVMTKESFQTGRARDRGCAQGNGKSGKEKPRRGVLGRGHAPADGGVWQKGDSTRGLCRTAHGGARRWVPPPACTCQEVEAQSQQFYLLLPLLLPVGRWPWSLQQPGDVLSRPLNSDGLSRQTLRPRLPPSWAHRAGAAAGEPC